MSKLLTPDDVAATLQVPRGTVLALHRAGTLRGRRLGREVRFSPAVVDRFVAGLDSEGGA